MPKKRETENYTTKCGQNFKKIGHKSQIIGPNQLTFEAE